MVTIVSFIPSTNYDLGFVIYFLKCFWSCVSNCCTSLQRLPVVPCQDFSLLLLVSVFCLGHNIWQPSSGSRWMASIHVLPLFLVQAGLQCQVVRRICSFSNPSAPHLLCPKVFMRSGLSALKITEWCFLLRSVFQL